MFCETYRKALNEAAVSNERLPADVQAHLAACASCREDKALFDLIEAELRTSVNVETPASLLPRVKQEITASPAVRTWRAPVLAYVASGLVVGAIGVSFAVRTRVKPEPSPRAVSSPASSEPSATQRTNESGEAFVSRSQSRRPPRVVLQAKAEVLVSAEEQLGLQRYAATLRNTKAPAVVKGDSVAEIEPLEIARVEVKQLFIQPLESGDAN